MTVRSSKALVVNSRPFYGLVDIDGKAYLPLALGDGNNALMSDTIHYSNWDCDWVDEAFINVDAYDLPPVLPDYCLTPPSGNVIGTAQLGPTVRIPSEYHKSYSKVPTLTLNGRFPMVKVSDLFQGCTVSDQDSAIYVEIPLDSRRTLPDVKKEPDLVGQALTGLLHSTPKETVRAILDYLVNTLTYNPFNAVSEAAYETASEQYELEHNSILACKYGVCRDYTELFQEMCLQAGIPCEFVSGFAGGDGSHA